MSGYEPSRFLQTYLPKDSLCSVCTYIMRNPVLCSKCKFSCCQDCGKKGPLVCQHAFYPNSSLRSKIANMNIKCKNWTKGCLEILQIGNVDKHEDSGCYFSHFTCGKKDCEEISLPGKIKHMPECSFFIVPCDTCKKEMKQSDRENHQCVDWLNTIVSNLNTKITILKNENTELSNKNKNLKEVFSVKGPELDNEITDYKERTENLAKEIENFKVSMQSEIQGLKEKGIDKMIVFHGNAETRLKGLWNRAQFDYDHLTKRLNDHMKTYLDNVNNLLVEFANKTESEELAWEGEKAKPNGANLKISENIIEFPPINGNKSADKPQKVQAQAVSNKVNKTKSPIAQK